ncbi:MAG: PVC-type heme-binding CxxCH protein, partial [Pirellulales bacterium]
GDGRFDTRKVFLDGGRNLTGIALGHGGVWLTSPPELVFVADRDRDDRPDGPAEPILDGFNATNVAHNVVNGLLWGPDGWLYGRHGIQATSRVGRPGDPDAARTPIDCSIWRVHPQTRRFEVVARGTTNPWGLDYDDFGEMIFTNNVIGHLWHLIPGGHYERMYGVDPEPHVYELMPQCADHLHWPGGAWKDSREVAGKLDPAVDSLGGGHSHCGGMIYLGDMFPESYRGKIFMCNTHGKRVNVDRLEYGSRGIVGRHEPDFLKAFDKAFDTWFRGIELVSGPDGRVWIADWTDKGECHDHDGVHRTSGRIYTVLHGSPQPPAPIDLHAQTDAELVKLQLHRNDWWCRRAREILAERAAAGRDLSAAATALRRLAETHADPTRRLRGLWAAQAIAVG